VDTVPLDHFVLSTTLHLLFTHFPLLDRSFHFFYLSRRPHVQLSTLSHAAPVERRRTDNRKGKPWQKGRRGKEKSPSPSPLPPESWPFGVIAFFSAYPDNPDT
jgi:hypothetical protein